MNTFEAFTARYSYRGNYLPAAVPREHLNMILEAGCAAPSGCNKQTTSFIAVDDPDVLKKLHAVMEPPLGDTAPALICVLTREIVPTGIGCLLCRTTLPPLKICYLP